MKKIDNKKYWQKFQEIVDNSLEQFRNIDYYTRELDQYKQQTSYYKAKVEAYERMLVKAKLITSDKERLIKFDKIAKGN